MHYFSGAFMIARKRVCAASFTKFFVKKFSGLDKGFDKPLSLCGSRRKRPQSFALKKGF